MIKKGLLLLSFIFTIWTNHLWGYFYSDDFSSSAATSDNWQMNLRYGRVGLAFPRTSADVAVNATTEELEFTGPVNDKIAATSYIGTAPDPYAYQALWCGNMMRYTNQSFNPNDYEPFGYEIRRTYAWIDPHDDDDGDDNNNWDGDGHNESWRHRNAMSLWLVEDTDLDNTSPEFSTFSESVFLFEMMRVCWDLNDGTVTDNRETFSVWGYNSEERLIDLSSLNPPDGANSVDASSTNNTGDGILRWNYENRRGYNQSGGNGTIHDDHTNINEIIIRLTHDGGQVRFYVNLDPNDSLVSYSNTFLLMKELNVGWSNDVQAMIGVEATRFDTEGEQVNFDDFTIRSICSSVTSEVSTLETIANQTTTVTGLIVPAFSSANEAGIQEFYIDMPSNFPDWDQVANFTVHWASNVILTGDTPWTSDLSTVKTFTSSAASTAEQEPANADTVQLIYQNSLRRLKVRFYANTDGDNSVFHPDHTDVDTNDYPAIMFTFDVDTPATADSSGDQIFDIYVHNQKYDSTGWTKYATTEMMKSHSREVNMPAGIFDSLSVRIYNPMDNVFAGIRPGWPPNYIYEGVLSTIYYDVTMAYSTNNNADVSRVLIKIPDGFMVEPSTISSERIASSSMGITTNGGDLFVYADYAASDTVLVAGSGFDTVSFSISDTTNFSHTNEVQVVWNSYAESQLHSGTYTNMTNTIFPTMTMLIRKKPPIGDGYIQPLDNGNVAEYVKNNVNQNEYKITVRNLGDSGNLIRNVLIQLDPELSDLSNITTGLGSSNYVFTATTNTNVFTNDLQYIVINYTNTNLINNRFDTVTFWADDTIPALTNDLSISNFRIYADNNNGDGWVELDTGSEGLSITFVSPVPQMKGYVSYPVEENGDNAGLSYHYIYTDIETTTNVQLSIQNTGLSGNDISGVWIYIPKAKITNVSSVSSTVKGGLVTNYTNATYQVIQVLYTNTNWLIAEDVGEKDDIIEFSVADNINAQENVTMMVYASNVGTNVVQAGNLGSDNMVLHFIYPPVEADSYAVVPGPLDFIIAETNEHELQYIIYNRGRTGNDILKAKVFIPTNYITNIQKVSNVTAKNGSIFFSGSPIDGYWELDINYGSGDFPGQTSDSLVFKVWDNINNSKVDFDVTCSISNRRWITNNIGSTPSFSQKVDINPPETSFSYSIRPTIYHNARNGNIQTNTLVISVSNRGLGSNKLKKVRINVPSEFSGNVIAVSNAYMQLTDTADGPVQISNGNYIWIDYNTNATPLDALTGDSIYLEVVIDQEYVFNTDWEVWAVNYSTTEQLTNTGIIPTDETNRLWLLNKPYGYIQHADDGDNRILTTVISNQLRLTFQNGDSNAGKIMSNIMVAVSAPFSAVSNIISSNLNGNLVSNYVLGTTNFFEINYPNGVIPLGSDTVYFTAYDTNVNEMIRDFRFWVNYDQENGWLEGSEWSGYSMSMSFTNPSAQGVVYASPTYFPRDYPTNQYTLYLTNEGVNGNNIYHARIIPPAFITNISSVSSLTRGSTYISIVDHTNVYIYYTNEYVLSNGQADVVQFIGSDNFQPPTNDTQTGVWTVYVDNTEAGVAEIEADVMPGKNSELNLVKPAYQARVYIHATNSISTNEENTIYSTLLTNYLKFEVQNNSGSTYNINSKISKIRINIPDLMDVSSLEVLNWTRGTNYSDGNQMVMIYTNFLPSYSNDNILFKINDQINFMDTNLTWSAEAAYISTYGNYYSALKAVGKSLTMQYSMPLLNARSYISPNNIWKDFPTNEFNLTISNRAVETDNHIYSVRFTAPGFITNITNVSSSNHSGSITVQKLAGNDVRVYYTNTQFNPGSFDMLSFIAYDNVNTNTNGAWQVFGSHSTNIALETNISVKLGKSLALNVKEPSVLLKAYIEATNSISSEDRNSIYSTETTNYLKLYFINQSVAGNDLTRVTMNIPSQVDSNTLTILNWDGGTNTVADGVITLFYTNYLLSGSNDTVIFRVVDEVENVSSIADWSDIQAAFTTTYYQYRDISLYSGKSLEINYVMPDLQATAYASPQTVWMDFNVTNYQITITNKATEVGNNIYKVKIMSPGFITNMENIISANFAGTMDYFITNSHELWAYYTNTAIGPGEYDVISFDGFDSCDSLTNDYISNWVVYADNTTDRSGEETLSAPGGEYTLNLSIQNPDYITEADLEISNSISSYEKLKIYSTLTTNLFRLSLRNNSVEGNNLTRVRISLPDVYVTNGLTVDNQYWNGVTNAIISSNSQYYIYLNYTNSLLPGTNDLILITLLDRVSNRSTNVIWDIDTVYNTTANKFKPADDFTVQYIMPDPNAEGYITPTTISRDFPYKSYTLYLTNKGTETGNDLYHIGINIPNAITNLMNLNSLHSDAVFEKCSQNLVVVHYTNDSLAYGEGDVLTFDGYDNIQTNDYHSNWTIIAYNALDESVSGQITTRFGESFDLDIIRYPYYSKAYLEITNRVSEVYPNNIYASAITNYVEFYLYNVSLSGNNLLQSRLRIPDMVQTNSIVISNSIKTVGVTNYLSNGFIYLDYSVSNLKPGEFDRWWVVYTDNWNNANTNVYWETESAFDTSYGLFSDTDEYGGKSLYVNYIMPDPHGQTYVTPKIVSQDYPFMDYSIFISNTATEENNRITFLDIEIPDVITNIANITSTYFNTSAVFTQPTPNLLRVHYTNTNFLMGMKDTITMRGYDRLSTNEYSTNWYVTVKNTTDGSGGTNADIEFGKSTKLQIIRYPYSAQAYMEAQNSMIAYNKNLMSVTEVTNEMKFYIYNQSSTGNKLTYARIDIPSAGLDIDTNWMEISNLIRISNVVVSISNDAIYLDYSAQPISAQQNDIVRVRFRDNIETNETSHVWSVATAFDTTYNLYKSASVYSGKSLAMDYDMPQPSVTMGFTPDEMYINRSSMWISMSISNNGELLNRIDQIKLELPDEISSGFTTASVSNSLASSIAFINGQLQMNYSDFKGGMVDQFYLKLSNIATNKGARYISGIARNYINTNIIEGNETFTILNMPTYYVYPNQVETIKGTNEVEIYINNDINGESSIKQIIFEFPAPISGLASFSSYLEPQILGNVTSLTLDYELSTNSIIPGDYDIITLNLIDNLEMGSNSITINGYVNNGDGFVPLEIKSGRSSDIVFTMSEPESTSGIDPNQISLGMESNQISVSITNNGTGSSRLTYGRVYLPEAFTSIADISSVNGSVVYNSTEHRLDVDYSLAMVQPGQSDEVSFAFENTMLSITNLNLKVEVANVTNNPQFTVSPGEFGDNHVISVTYPPLFAECYFSSANKVYIIETNAQLTYRIVNRSYQTELTQAVISFTTNVFNNISITGERVNAVSQNANGTEFTIDFGNNAIEFMEAEDLTLSLDYKLNMLTDITLETRVWVTGATNADFNAITVNEKNTYIRITNSTWGLVQGSVVPEWRLANVKLYKTGSSNVSTNVEGNNIAGISDVGTGVYQLSRIPAGTYDIEFTAPYYRTIRISNVQIYANQLTSVNAVTMRNAPLTSESASETIYNFDDTNTFVVFPEGSVDDSFSIDIEKYNLTAKQRLMTSGNSTITAPTTTNNLWGYQFVLNDFEDFPLDGVPLDIDATLNLSYEELDIESYGWNESQLGIYYWDDNGGVPRWISVGGKVDVVEDVIVAKSSYLHEYYAIFAKGSVVTDTIGNVVVRPKVFTPESENSYYNSIRISFEFDQEYDSYEVKIYDISGKLVRHFERSGSYSQGEVVWDATDEDDYTVDSGVYVYQVKAGNAVYSGTVIIAR